MTSVSPISTGISDLMRMYASVANPSISSLLSSSQMQSALSKAPPFDIVQLSDQAMQLQEVDSLFGATNPLQTVDPGLAMQSMLMSFYSSSLPAPSTSPGSLVNLLA
jgi:hypothetical protein